MASSKGALLQGRTALVTGASKPGDIGAAIATCYAQHGANVSKLCEATGRGGWIRSEPCDLSKSAGVDALVKAVLGKYGGVDILVANAGSSLGGSDVLKGDPDGWDTMLDINVLAPMRLTRLLTPSMVERGGRAVIFTGSLAGVRPTKSSAYGASKYAIRFWAESCYEHLRTYNIKVSFLEPGYVDTPMVSDVSGDHSLFIQPSDLAEAALLPFKLTSAAPLEVVLRLCHPVES